MASQQWLKEPHILSETVKDLVLAAANQGL